MHFPLQSNLLHSMSNRKHKSCHEIVNKVCFFSWPNYLNGKNRRSCWLITFTKAIFGLSTRCPSSPSSILWSNLESTKMITLILYFLWIKHHALLRSGTNMLNNWGRCKNAFVRTFIIFVISCQVVSGIWNQFLNFLFHTYIQTDERYPSC